MNYKAFFTLIFFSSIQLQAQDFDWNASLKIDTPQEKTQFYKRITKYCFSQDIIRKYASSDYEQSEFILDKQGEWDHIVQKIILYSFSTQDIFQSKASNLSQKDNTKIQLYNNYRQQTIDRQIDTSYALFLGCIRPDLRDLFHKDFIKTPRFVIMQIGLSGL